MHDEIQVNKDHVFTLKYYQNNIQIVPTSATLTVYDNAGSSKQTGAGVVATDGTITWTLLAANIAAIGKNFKLSISYVYQTVTYTDNRLFDVVRHPLVCTVRDEDLFSHLGELRTKCFTKNGRTTATGTTASFIDLDLSRDPREWVGGRVRISISETLTHEAEVTAFAAATGTVTFAPAVAANVSSGLYYRMRESYKAKIETAFQRYVFRDLRNRKVQAAGYIDGRVVNNLVIIKALELICIESMESDLDKWKLRADRYSKEYESEMMRLNAPYDDNSSGDISDSESANRVAFTSVDLTQ